MSEINDSKGYTNATNASLKIIEEKLLASLNGNYDYLNLHNECFKISALLHPTKTVQLISSLTLNCVRNFIDSKIEEGDICHLKTLILLLKFREFYQDSFLLLRTFDMANFFSQFKPIEKLIRDAFHRFQIKHVENFYEISEFIRILKESEIMDYLKDATMMIIQSIIEVSLREFKPCCCHCFLDFVRKLYCFALEIASSRSTKCLEFQHTILNIMYSKALDRFGDIHRMIHLSCKARNLDEVISKIVDDFQFLFQQSNEFKQLIEIFVKYIVRENTRYGRCNELMVLFKSYTNEGHNESILNEYLTKSITGFDLMLLEYMNYNNYFIDDRILCYSMLNLPLSFPNLLIKNLNDFLQRKSLALDQFIMILSALSKQFNDSLILKSMQMARKLLESNPNSSIRFYALPSKYVEHHHKGLSIDNFLKNRKIFGENSSIFGQIFESNELTVEYMLSGSVELKLHIGKKKIMILTNCYFATIILLINHSDSPLGVDQLALEMNMSEDIIEPFLEKLTKIKLLKQSGGLYEVCLDNDMFWDDQPISFLEISL
ncbi:MAG: hypothetical protein MHMPM18_001754 [Marteilia pararefringens]